MRRRLFALLIAPLLALAVLGAQLTNTAATERVAADETADLVRIATKVAALDAALGTETLHAISANEVLASSRQRALANAELSTDNAIKDLAALLETAEAGSAEPLRASTAGVRSAMQFRADLKTGTLTPLQLVDRYATLRTGLLAATVGHITAQNNVGRTDELIGLVSLIQARSAHLDERLALDLALRYQTWAPGQHSEFVNSLALQRERLSMASSLVSSTIPTASPELASLRREMRLLEREVPMIDRSTWRDISGQWLDQLNTQVQTTEQRLTDQVASDTAAARNNQRATMAGLALTLVVAVASAAFLSVRLIRRVETIAEAVSDVSLETTPTVRLNEDGNDEISGMATAFNRMSDRLGHSSSVRRIESDVLGSIAAGEALTTTVALCGQLLSQGAHFVTSDGVVSLVTVDGRELALDDTVGDVSLADDQLAIGLAQLAQWRSASLATLRKRATIDDLTGVHNRASSLQNLAHLCNVDRPAVLFLDLDNFKRLNDAHGHDAGDEALSKVAAALTAAVGDAGLVGRLGGDEFIVIVPGNRSIDWLTQLAGRILNRIDQLRGFASTGISASIGIAPSDAHQTFEELLQESDAAMYQAKVDGRGRVVVVDAALRRELEAMKEVERGLSGALANNDFSVAYQGIWSTDGHTLTALEALARWTDPAGTSHSPALFFAIAERHGYASDIDHQILAKVATHIADSLKAGLQPPPIHVNMSAQSLKQPDIVTSVLATLRAASCPPQAIVLEITESALISEIDDASDRLNLLRRAGIKIAIDDFGEGYSSLRYLSKLPIDVLKIDRQFIDGIDHTPNNIAIVRAIAGLASSLGMTVIAEGVEQPPELHRVTDLGCSHVQGFLFDRPKPWSEVVSKWSTSFVPNMVVPAT